MSAGFSSFCVIVDAVALTCLRFRFLALSIMLIFILRQILLIIRHLLCTKGRAVSVFSLTVPFSFMIT